MRNIRRVGPSFQVLITFQGSRYYLGSFKSVSKAVKARDSKIRELHLRVPTVNSAVPRPSKTPANVVRIGDRFQVRVSRLGKRHYVGTFHTVSEAVQARERKYVELGDSKE